MIQNNGWNTQILQILNEECDGIFYLSGNQLSRIQNPVELTHKCVSKVFKYQEPFVYAIFLYESEEDPFQVLPGRTKVGVIRKPISGVTKLYIFKDRKGAFVFYSLSSSFYLLAKNLHQIVLKTIIYLCLKK